MNLICNTGNINIDKNKKFKKLDMFVNFVTIKMEGKTITIP